MDGASAALQQKESFVPCDPLALSWALKQATALWEFPFRSRIRRHRLSERWDMETSLQGKEDERLGRSRHVREVAPVTIYSRSSKDKKRCFQDVSWYRLVHGAGWKRLKQTIQCPKGVLGIRHWNSVWLGNELYSDAASDPCARGARRFLVFSFRNVRERLAWCLQHEVEIGLLQHSVSNWQPPQERVS